MRIINVPNPIGSVLLINFIDIQKHDKSYNVSFLIYALVKLNNSLMIFCLWSKKLYLNYK